jgi:hypothetical protein
MPLFEFENLAYMLSRLYVSAGRPSLAVRVAPEELIPDAGSIGGKTLLRCESAEIEAASAGAARGPPWLN